MSLTKLCRFPITRYEGDYRPTWTRNWTRLGGKGGSWQFFGYTRDIVLDNDGQPYTWDGEYGIHTLFPMLAGPRNDWGAFDLVGILQLDDGRNIYKACGCISLNEYDLGFFMHAGKKVDEHREKNTYRMTPDVFCIPGVGGNLTLVTMNKNRIEVYFLSGHDTGEWMSKLPGMDEFYRMAKIKKLFANILGILGGVCGQNEKCDDDHELWRRTETMIRC